MQKIRKKITCLKTDPLKKRKNLLCNYDKYKHKQGQTEI